jgi:hypothetical protein
MDLCIGYNSCLTAEQFLFHEMRIVAKQYLAREGLRKTRRHFPALRRPDLPEKARTGTGNTSVLIGYQVDHTGSQEHRISFLESQPNFRGILSVDKLVHVGFDTEENLIFSVVTEVDDDMVNRIMELPAMMVGDAEADAEGLDALRQANMERQKAEIERINKECFLAECIKLDAFSEDLKEGLQRELKDLNKEITEKKRAFKASTDKPLAEMLEMKEEVSSLEEKRKKLRRELYNREDEIDSKNEKLQDEIRSKLEGTSTIENIMTISFEIV